MLLQVLGPLQVQMDEAVQIRRPSHRRLLSILALEPDQRVTLDRLIDLYWPDDPPATARAALHTHISSLRRLIGEGVITTERDGYLLSLEDGTLDAQIFLETANQARRAAKGKDWEGVTEHVNESLRLWRGPPYQELSDDHFATPSIARLAETYLELLEMRAEALLALGRPGDALPDLEKLTLEHPLRERLWEHLMLARYRLGRHREALTAFQDISSSLAEAGLEPGPPLRQLEERILLHDRSLIGVAHNLTAELDAYIPREKERRELEDLISNRRLVTVTGSGGVGKTRLAVRTARGLFDRFPHGIWMVELAGIDDPRLVPTEIAHAMGVRHQGGDPLDTVTELIGTDQVLLILDNCEHLATEAAASATRLLQRAPNLRIIATSREQLRVPGETLYQLLGMMTPEKSVPLAEASSFEAVALFIERARQVRAGRPIEHDEMDAVVSICRRLDGLPLAVELAAARTAALSVRQMAERLTSADFLSTRGSATGPDRQETLEATIDWSYRMLGDDEAEVFEQLSVFRGGFTLEAAGQIAQTSGKAGVATMVAGLVEKSLVDVLPDGDQYRYRLLETVRQFAGQRLARSPAGETAARDRLVDWARLVTTDLWRRVLAGERRETGRVLGLEADNIQAALVSARAKGQGDAATELSHALAWNWYINGQLGPAIDILGNCLDDGVDAADSAPTRALLARCHAYAEDVDEALRVAERAVAEVDAVKVDLIRVWVLSTMQLCLFMSALADPTRMLPLANRSLQIAESTSDPQAELIGRQTAADGFAWNGRTEEALKQQRRVLGQAASTDNPEVIGRHFGQSVYNFMLSSQTRASEPIRVAENWRALATVDEQAWLTTATDWLPWIYMQHGDLEAAAKASERLGDRTLEGYNRTIFLIVRATVSWMRGALNRAKEDVDEIESRKVNERWWHVFYPLAAEVCADRDDLDEVNRFALEYLALPVHPSKETPKLGVLYPLIRALVDKAVRTGESDHAGEAYEVFDRMEQTLAEHPPLPDSWTSIMTHTQNLVFAEAELTRLTGADPEAWAQAEVGADHAYYRLYAHWRSAEAMLQLDRRDEGASALRDAHRTALEMGAKIMLRRITTTARANRLTL